MIKHFLHFILFIGCFILFFFVVKIGYDRQSLSLAECKQYENIIIERGISRNAKDSKIFFISLKGLDQKIGVYRMFQNYDTFLEKIQVGEKVKVFYLQSPDENEDINIDLIQIEKDGQIILDQNEYKNKYRIMIVIGILGCIYLLRLFLNYINMEIRGIRF